MAAALSLTLGAGLPAGSSDLAVGIHGAPGKPGGEACERTGVSTAPDPTGNPPRTSTSVAVVGSCRGVRPGALVRTQRGVCTLNFVFAASDRRRYVATAGHCVLGTSAMLEDIGERRWAVSRGPVARDREGRRIGEFAYAVLARPKDFAVIRLPRRGRRPSSLLRGGADGYQR